MEILDIVTSAIANLGFPIACCIGLFYKMGKDDTRHKEEVDELRKAIDRNTEVIASLSEHLRGD